MTKRQRMEISKLRNIKLSSKEEQPVLVGARMELEVIRTPVEMSMDELATVVREAYTKHPEVHEHLREWLLSDDGMEMAQEYDVAALELNNVALQPKEVKDLLQENAKRVAAEKQHPELFPLASLTRRLTVRHLPRVGRQRQCAWICVFGSARDKEQLVRQPRDAGWLFVADPEAPLGLV